MSLFHLKIATPAGLAWSGEARQLTLRTTEGEMTVLPRHIAFAAALKPGKITVADPGGIRRAALCGGGLITVREGNVTLVSDSFEWSDSSPQLE